MVDAVNLAYSFKGKIGQLLEGVRKSCDKMSLVLTDERIDENGFSITASQRTNWLSSAGPKTPIFKKWPAKF